jgi:anti-sigma factor ChrR (cupin superfamily)
VSSALGVFHAVSRICRSETAIRNHLRRGEPKISSPRAIARATKFSAQWLVEGEEQEGSQSEAANVSALNDLLKIPRSEH